MAQHYGLAWHVLPYCALGPSCLRTLASSQSLLTEQRKSYSHKSTIPSGTACDTQDTQLQAMSLESLSPLVDDPRMCGASWQACCHRHRPLHCCRTHLHHAAETPTSKISSRLVCPMPLGRPATITVSSITLPIVTTITFITLRPHPQNPRCSCRYCCCCHWTNFHRCHRCCCCPPGHPGQFPRWVAGLGCSAGGP